MKRLTVDEVARSLERHPELIRRWLRIGRLRGARVGWSWLITPAEVERFKRTAVQRRRH